jgi:hypothetical protein
MANCYCYGVIVMLLVIARRSCQSLLLIVEDAFWSVLQCLHLPEKFVQMAALCY